VGSDNGPPFNEQDFLDFGKYLGFKHEHKTPKNPKPMQKQSSSRGCLRSSIAYANLQGRTSDKKYTDFYAGIEQRHTGPQS